MLFKGAKGIWHVCMKKHVQLPFAARESGWDYVKWMSDICLIPSHPVFSLFGKKQISCVLSNKKSYMFILQSSHSAVHPWRQIYNNIQMLVKLYTKMFRLNNRIKAEERKVLILIFMLTFKIKVIFFFENTGWVKSST